MNQGYIKLYRKSLDSQVFNSPELWKLWTLCLLQANHKEAWVKIQDITEPIKVLPGQFITGRFSLHKDYYPGRGGKQKSPLTVWRWLLTLEKMGNLNIKTNNKYSIVTIMNWGIYQSKGTQDEQVSKQQVNNGRTRDEHRMSTNKNDLKNEKNDLKNEERKEIYARFEKFWLEYPKRKSKGQAEKAFLKIDPDGLLLTKMIATIEEAKKSEDWLKENGKYIPYPATWLNAKGWEDEHKINPLDGVLSDKGQATVRMLQSWAQDNEEEDSGDEG